MSRFEFAIAVIFLATAMSAAAYAAQRPVHIQALLRIPVAVRVPVAAHMSVAVAVFAAPAAPVTSVPDRR